MKIDSLSVFFPAFNEEKNITTTVEKALVVLKKLPLKNYEIIIVVDGSTDSTLKMAQLLAEKNSRVRLIIHPKNKGYGEALKSGFYNSKYPWIVFTDADGQFNFSEITNLIDKADQADIVAGFRINRQDSWQRKIFGSLWTLLTNILLGIGVRDVDCAFKLINKKVINTIPKLKSTRGAMISPELLARAHKGGFKIIEVGVHHYPRTSGQQSGANMKVVLKSFIDLGKLWWTLQ